MRSAILLGLLVLAGGCAAPPPLGQAAAPSDARGTPGSATRGHVLAQTQCSGCHAVDRQGDSPLADAPPFRTLSQRYPVADLQEAFGEGLVTAHPTMPQFQFEAADVADLIAYLETVSNAETDRRR